MFCAKCGSTVENGVKFCPACGENMISAAAPAQGPAYTPPPPAYQAPAYQPPPQPAYQPGMPYQNPALREPLSVGAYFVTFLIFCIPLVNVIMMFVWAFSSETNINKKNLCRAMLIWAIIGVVLGIIWAILAATILSSIGSSYSYYY